MKHLGTIKLETERLILRRFKEDDANMIKRLGRELVKA